MAGVTERGLEFGQQLFLVLAEVDRRFHRDAAHQVTHRTAFTAADKAFIEAQPFFFLATSSPDGHCDCSFKGGGPRLIRILDEKTFAFPDFDGNGAFMSLGNILLNPQVGCLFIDFNDGGRLRVNGRASVHESGPVAALFPAHKRVVLVDIEQVVPNCPQHVPRLQAVA